MELDGLNDRDMQIFLNDINDIVRKNWIKPELMLKNISDTFYSLFKIEYDKILISGETDNVSIYIIKNQYVLAIMPLSDLKNNILLSNWDSNWSKGRFRNNHYNIFKLDNKLKELLNMPKILLINLSVVENFPIPRLNLSTGVIASFLRKKQMANVKIIDMQIGITIDQIVSQCLEIHPDIIGISVSFGQKDLANTLLEKLFLNNIKSLITIGNIIPSLYPLEFIEKFPQVIVSYGEGEVTMPDLIKHIKGKLTLKEVNGIKYKDEFTGDICTNRKNTIDMSEVPLPALDTLEDIAKLKGALTLETSRGCNYSKCTFCPRQHKLSKWRYMSSNQTVSQIEKLVLAGKSLGIKQHIYLADEEFIGQLPDGSESKRIVSICSEIISKELNIKFDTSARADSVYNPDQTYEWNIEKIEMWNLCKLAGLDRLFVGVESGCNSQLNRYGKGTSVEQNVIALRILTALGINIRIGFVMFDPLMIGLNDLKENLEFLERTDAILNPIDISNMSYSELYERLLYDKDFIEQNSKKVPIYSVVSYMLASLEVLVGSPYKNMVKIAEKEYHLNLILNEGNPDSNMGRYIVKYVDKNVGALSLACQQWIDSNFSIMYTIKSLCKSEKSSRKFLLYKYMERHREISQYLLKYLIFNIEQEPEIDQSFLSFLEKVGYSHYIEFNFEYHNDLEITNKITMCMDKWQHIMRQLVNDILSDLEEGIIQDTYDSRLKLSIKHWFDNFNKWKLINDMEIKELALK